MTTHFERCFRLGTHNFICCKEINSRTFVTDQCETTTLPKCVHRKIHIHLNEYIYIYICIVWCLLYAEVQFVPLQGTLGFYSAFVRYGPRPVVLVELLRGPAARGHVLLPVRLVPVCLFRPATSRTSRCAPAGKRSSDHQPPK
jgi:hypothetical protein